MKTSVPKIKRLNKLLVAEAMWACDLPSERGNTGSHPCKCCFSPTRIPSHTVKAAKFSLRLLSRATHSSYVGLKIELQSRLSKLAYIDSTSQRLAPRPARGLELVETARLVALSLVKCWTRGWDCVLLRAQASIVRADSCQVFRPNNTEPPPAQS